MPRRWVEAVAFCGGGSESIFLYIIYFGFGGIKKSYEWVITDHNLLRFA